MAKVSSNADIYSVLNDPKTHVDGYDVLYFDSTGKRTFDYNHMSYTVEWDYDTYTYGLC